jgi:UDP-galactopyranose mutase
MPRDRERKACRRELSYGPRSRYRRAKAVPFLTKSPANFEEAALASLGQELYEGFFGGYTKKQWSRDPKDIPASVFRRLPIHLKKDANVFHHKRQGQPRDALHQGRR